MARPRKNSRRLRPFSVGDPQANRSVKVWTEVESIVFCQGAGGGGRGIEPGSRAEGGVKGGGSGNGVLLDYAADRRASRYKVIAQNCKTCVSRLRYHRRVA